jgi:hypothetical protein
MAVKITVPTEKAEEMQAALSVFSTKPPRIFLNGSKARTILMYTSVEEEYEYALMATAIQLCHPGTEARHIVKTEKK